MGNIILSLKKMIVNKTTVTVFGLILCLFIVFYSYNRRVESSIKPVDVPYAKQKILAGKQIKKNMVGNTQVPPSMLEGDVIRDSRDVIDKYVNADTIIPEGSLFFERTVVEKEELPANIILDYPDGYKLYNLPVNIETTYGNSIYPGNYIDIYMTAEKKVDTGDGHSENKRMNGKLLSNVKVLAVKDKDGLPVFDSVDEIRTPSMIVFALPEEYFLLITSASYLRTYQTEIYPVPRNEETEDKDEIEANSQSLREWVKSVTDWKEQ